MSSTNIKVKFTKNNNSDFMKTLKTRLDEYFKNKPNGYLADGRMWFKIAFWMITWAATWFAIMFLNLPTYIKLMLAFAHLFTHLFIAFNIAHDANHGAVSKQKWVNNLLSFSLDLIGVNSYLWRYSHNTAHHSYVNIDGADTSSEGHGILRFTMEDKWKPAFKYQYLYAPLIYSVLTINYVFSKDFWIFSHLKNYQTGMKPTAAEWFKLISTKLFYYSYTLILPTLLLPYSFWQILAVFLLGHAMLGMMLAFTFQTGHLTEGTSFPHKNEDGNVEKNWAIHIVETTGDFARKSKFWCWMLGGINVHVIHHLFPKICHTHYAEVAPIVQKTAEEYGLEYRNIEHFTTAIASHFKLLKQLGEKPTNQAA
jgi:linoleoyl-CoA desaturase